MLLRKKNGLNFTPQDFFDSHVCNLHSRKTIADCEQNAVICQHRIRSEKGRAIF